MKYNVIDYTVVDGEVTIKAIGGYNSTTDIPEAEENVGRLVAENVSDIASLGEAVLEAIAKYKACEATPEAIWEKFNPTPKGDVVEAHQRDLTSPKKKSTSKKPAVDNSETKEVEVKKENKSKSKSKAKEKSKGNAKKAVAPKKAAAPKKAVAPKKARKAGELRGDKVLMVKRMLLRKNGVTGKEIKEATGWKAVSMPAMAKHARLKLRKEKEKGKPTRYYGSE